MSLLFESIQISQRRLINLPYHQDRVNRSRAALFHEEAPLHLEEHIQVPQSLSKGVYKCRVSYGRDIHQVKFTPYIPRPISSLKLVAHDTIDYPFKYEDRQLLHELWSQRGSFDDILLVKHGYITDTYYCNIVFWDGQTWVTPTTCLLPGTQRARLLREGYIQAEEVKPADLPRFRYAKLINAMLDWETGPVISVKAII